MGMCGVSSDRCIVLLLVLSVSHAVSSPHRVRGVFGASVILPCDGSAYRGIPEAQLDILWQTQDFEEVARYNRGVHSVGLNFEGRVTFSPERIRQADFSINISSVTFRDWDVYECWWNPWGPNETHLRDVHLHIIGPPFSRNLSVQVGDSVTLPCYGRIDKWEQSSFWWKRGDELVLNHGSEVTYGPNYTGRASVHSERVQNGDFALSLRKAVLCDSGFYHCSAAQTENASLFLRVHKDFRNLEPVNLGLGMSLRLILPQEPVAVLFSKGDAFDDEPLCSVDTGGFKCEPKYKSRMERKSNTLTMLNMTLDDEGTYTVIHTSNCVTHHAYRVNIKHNINHHYYIPLLLFALLLIAVLCMVCRKKCPPSGQRECLKAQDVSQSSSQDGLQDGQKLLKEEEKNCPKFVV